MGMRRRISCIELLKMEKILVVFTMKIKIKFRNSVIYYISLFRKQQFVPTYKITKQKISLKSG